MLLACPGPSLPREGELGPVWGVGAASLLPDVYWGVSEVCLLAGSKQRWRCRTPKREPKPTG